MNKVFLQVMTILPNPPYFISPTIFKIMNLFPPPMLEPWLSTTKVGRCSIDNSIQQVNEDIWTFPTTSYPILKLSCSKELPFFPFQLPNFVGQYSIGIAVNLKNFNVHSVYALTDVQIPQNGYWNYFHLNTQKCWSFMIRNF
jgi:hypothetical protein